MVMRALDRKLLRDLWRMRGQVLAIGLIMACGIGVLVMGLATVEALDETARAYYERYRFAHVFAHVKRAPQRVVAQISALPGVQTVETRIVQSALLDIAGFDEPVVARLVSLPAAGSMHLNMLALRGGRMPRSHASDEALISEPFAQAHGLGVGAAIRAILNGTWRELTIVGIALSPEYVYAIGPGALMPDDLRFGVLWLGEEALQAAFDLTGAFNDASIALLRGASAQAVVTQLDRILERYGGIGAYERADQLSNWFLMNEIKQLRTLSRILPSVFLAVAAFLTNMVLARLIAIERSEIGLLKAFGYTHREIAFHYFKLALAIGAFGVLLGWLSGFWLGWYETRLYASFYHFPFLLFRPGPVPFAIGAAVGFGAALAGALRAVSRAARLAPAAAMQPPAPPMFRRTRLARFAPAARIEHLSRIILRQIGRWPLRSFTTCAGIAMSVAVLVTSMQWIDAIDHMVDVYFKQAQSQDITVSFAEPHSSESARDLGRMSGVQVVEAMRIVPAKLRSGWREQREALQGLPARQELFRVYDVRGQALSLPAEGLMISSILADMLHVSRGDSIEVEVLEGRRGTFEVPIAGIFETYIGSPAYIEIGALARLLKERPSVTNVHLRVDPRARPALLGELQRLPHISAITLKDAAIRTFEETMAETIMIFVSFFTVNRGPLQVTINDEGEARVHDVFVVSAPVAGLMRRVELEAGDHVAANETVIARLEPSAPMFLDERAIAEARAAVEAASAARKFAEAQSRRVQAEQEFAESELRRLRALASRQSISENELDAAERRAKTAVAAVAEAQAAMKMRSSPMNVGGGSDTATGSSLASSSGNLRTFCAYRCRPCSVTLTSGQFSSSRAAGRP